jgi:hypothetical protein
MIITLILLLLLFAVVILVSQHVSAASQRRLATNPAGYYLDAGVVRVFWAIITLMAGVAFPPLWLLSLFCFGSGIYCFSKCKELKAIAKAGCKE